MNQQKYKGLVRTGAAMKKYPDFVLGRFIEDVLYAFSEPDGKLTTEATTFLQNISYESMTDEEWENMECRKMNRNDRK